MRGITRIVLGTGLLWIVRSPLPAQEPARAPHIGAVVADGKPVAAAEVTFLGAPLDPGAPGDLVRVACDANGRFRASLLPTVRYVAWAARAIEGGTVVTAAVPRGSLATTIAFTGDEEKAPTSWRIGGLARWQQHGQIRVQMWIFGNDAVLAGATVDGDGRIALPPLPPLEALVHVFCGDRAVHAMTCSLRSDTELPPPRVVEAIAVDAREQPLAGVTIARLLVAWQPSLGPFHQEWRGEPCDLAVTDEAGKARLLVAHRSNPFLGVGFPAMVFVARREGCADAVSGFGKEPFEAGVHRPVGKAGKAVLRFSLATAETKTGKVLAPLDARPRTIALLGTLQLPHGKDSTTSVGEMQVRNVGADGVVETFRDAPQRTVEAVRVQVTLPVPAADDPFRRVPGPRSLHVPASALSAEGGLDLRQVLPLRLQVLDESGGPAVAAHVLCVARDGNQYLRPQYGTETGTDGSGRVVLPALPGSCFVLVVHGTAIGRLAVDVAPGLPAQTIRLQPLPRMAVRVVDANDKPLAGASFQLRGASWRGDADAEDDLINAVGYEVTQWLLEQVRTDAEGRAALPFLAGRGLGMDAEARWNGDEQASSEWRLAANDEPASVVIRARR